MNPPYVKTFQGGLLGTVGGTAVAPGVPGARWMRPSRLTRLWVQVFQPESFRAAHRKQIPSCLPPVAITAVPDGELRAPYFMEWSVGIQRQFARTGTVNAQYVGTRAVNQAYLTQVNGYQTVCQDCFAPFPYLKPADPRFGAVTQFSTGANSHYSGLQLSATKRLGHGLQGQVNYTWSHCMDTVSNGGFLQFAAGAILSPLPGDLARNYGPCDYDIRHNLTAQYVYQLPIKVQNHRLGYALNGWQVSGTAFFHSGIPFSVLSTPYSANGNGIVQGTGPQFASLAPGVPVYEHQADSGRHPARHHPMAQPQCFRFRRGSEHRGNVLAEIVQRTCQFGDLGRNALAGSGLRLE